MTELVYANGCSFTAGSELEHDPEFHAASCAAEEFRRLRSWPQVVGDALGATRVVNEARGGGSNARAVRMTYQFVYDYLASHRDPARLLVLVGITDLTRSEFRDSTGAWELLKPNLASRSNKNRRLRARNDLYYRHFFDVKHAVTVHAQQFSGLHAFLRVHGVRHHFHEAMPNNSRLISDHSGPAGILRSLDPRVWRGLSHEGLGRGGGHVALDPATSFEDWAVRSGVALGPGGHPLTDGHQQWAKLLRQDIQALV